MYNGMFVGEKMVVNGKSYTYNYLVTVVSNVTGFSWQMSSYMIMNGLTDEGIANLITRYQCGERW